jgi:hypothetical protein
VEEINGEAGAFARLGGDGKYYKSPQPRLAVITQGIKSRLSSTISTRSSSSTSTASTSDPVIETIAYDLDMFSAPLASLEVVSQAKFDQEVKRLEKAQERADKFDEDIIRQKPAIWILINNRIDLETINRIKSKTGYIERYNNYDVVWYFNTALEVKVTQSNGVPQVDFVIQQNLYFSASQYKNESGPQYYERLNNMKDNYHKLCTDRGVTPLEEKYLAAYFIIGLNDLVHAEFKNSVTNNAKSGILAYPVTIVDAYQRVTDFRPMIDKKYASTGPVTDAVIFAASEKFPSGNKGGKVKTTKVTVPADESDSKNKEKNRLKKTRERLKKKSRVDSNGVTRWMDTGNVISCDNCKKKHLPDNHFDINCPEAQCQLDSVIAESKKTKNTTLSESIFMMHSSTSCSVQHVMSASNDLHTWYY